MNRSIVQAPALVATIAAVATVMALGWTAAEGGRGLDVADLRTVVIVTLAVWLGARFARRSV